MHAWHEESTRHSTCLLTISVIIVSLESHTLHTRSQTLTLSLPIVITDHRNTQWLPTSGYAHIATIPDEISTVEDDSDSHRPPAVRHSILTLVSGVQHLCPIIEPYGICPCVALRGIMTSRDHPS
jgi:hypothetical protein